MCLLVLRAILPKIYNINIISACVISWVAVYVGFLMLCLYVGVQVCVMCFLMLCLYVGVQVCVMCFFFVFFCFLPMACPYVESGCLLEWLGGTGTIGVYACINFMR
jgi:hypothetical protein